MQRSAERVGLRRGDVRLLDLPENFGFADQHRVETGADAEKMLDGLVTEPSVKVGLDIVAGGAVTEVGQKRFYLTDAALVVGELGIDL